MRFGSSGLLIVNWFKHETRFSTVDSWQWWLVLLGVSVHLSLAFISLTITFFLSSLSPIKISLSVVRFRQGRVDRDLLKCILVPLIVSLLILWLGIHLVWSPAVCYLNLLLVYLYLRLVPSFYLLEMYHGYDQAYPCQDRWDKDSLRSTSSSKGYSSLFDCFVETLWAAAFVLIKPIQEPVLIEVVVVSNLNFDEKCCIHDATDQANKDAQDSYYVVPDAVASFVSETDGTESKNKNGGHYNVTHL